MYDYRNKGEHSIAIFLDISKPFNSINHYILFKKLDKLGTTGECKIWITEYLRDRKQFVRNCGIESDLKTINYGIPQGTVLGPLIYLYVNDIMNSNVKSDVIMFADDTAIIAHDTHLANAVSQIVDDIDRLSDGFCFNKLTLNLDKTKCMYFSKSV